MIERLLFYQNVEYKGRIYDFYYYAHQKGFGKIKARDLYNSNEFEDEKGEKGMHTISDKTIELIIENIIKIK